VALFGETKVLLCPLMDRILPFDMERLFSPSNDQLRIMGSNMLQKNRPFFQTDVQYFHNLSFHNLFTPERLIYPDFI